MNGKNDLRACPFPHEVKRGVFLEVCMDFGFVRGACSDCGAAGPFVTLAGHEATEDEKAEAVCLWNTRSSGWEDEGAAIEALRGLVKAVNTNELAAAMACHSIVSFANVEDALKPALALLRKLPSPPSENPNELA